MTNFFGVIAFLFGVSLASNVDSATVRFSASGVFQTAPNPNFFAGDPFSISLVFEDEATNLSTNPATEGLYRLPPVSASFAEFGSMRFSLGPTALAISNNAAGIDSINIGINGELQTIGPDRISQFGVFLQGDEQTFDGVGLDALGSEFGFAGFTVLFSGSQPSASGVFSSTSLEPLAPVPLPESGVLLLLGLSILCVRSKKVRRIQRC